MECGVPFCHHGCPLGNLIPDWNDLVYRDRWQEALEQLHRTNNFPEFTGRLCPAPCEAACVLEINEGDAVSIKQVELAIVNRGWDEGWIEPQRPAPSTGRSVAVVGSGPRGRVRAAAGARRRRRRRLRARRSGRRSHPASACPSSRSRSGSWSGACSSSLRRASSFASASMSARTSARRAAGTPRRRRRRDRLARSRDLPVPGRELDGVHFAMEYLYDRARALAGTAADGLRAAGKHVVVIGGGDTGADCVGTRTVRAPRR